MKLLELLEAALKDQQTSRNIDLIEDTFGPNPCTNLMFQDEAGAKHLTQCDSPRCPNCGLRKAAQLWQHVTSTFGPQATLYTITDDDDYTRLRDRIRQHKHRTGVEVHYISWNIGQGNRLLFTDADLDNAPAPTQTAAIKASLIDHYRRGVAALRKTWNIGTVTLSRSRLQWESVTGKLSWVRRLTKQEQSDLVLESERREMLREMGYDPDLWETFDFGEERHSIIDLWRTPRG